MESFRIVLEGIEGLESILSNSGWTISTVVAWATVAVLVAAAAVAFLKVRRRAKEAREFLSAIDDAVVVLDRDGRIVHFNSTARRRFSWFTDSVRGRKASEVMPFDSEQAGRVEAPDQELELETSDGRCTFDLHVSALARGSVLVLRDISRRKKDEQALRERAAIVNMLRGIASAANEAVDPGAAIRSVLTLMCSEMDWPVGHAWLLEENDSSILISSGIWYLRDENAHGSLREASERLRFRVGEGLPGRVLETGRAIWISDVESRTEDPRQRQFVDLALPAAFAIPLHVGSECVGILEFFASRGASPSPSFLEAVAQVGSQLSQVFERERAARDREALSQRLQEASRRAGKAELATGVVHNIGNALNGVTLGVGRLRNRLGTSRLAALEQVVERIRENSDDLATFFTQDERGKLVPEFLVEVTRDLASERDALLEDLSAVAGSTAHVSEIVRLQQEHAVPGLVIEKLRFSEVVDAAIELSGIEGAGPSVATIRKEVVDDSFESDRHVLLQVLVNLLANALDAIVESQQPPGEIVVRAMAVDELAVFQIRDDGIGIAKEKLERVFAQGYTTKASGQGVGLHASVLAVRQLGGDLRVESEGEQKGATFIVELPRRQGGGE